MTLNDAFLEFDLKIKMANLDDIRKHTRVITKKLNQYYYDLDDENKHKLIVGSVGRKTCINSKSDIDFAFILPDLEFKKYDNRIGNGQSNLLADVRKVLIDRFPFTTINADGQVIDIRFNDCLVELLPAFEQSDGSFKHVDTNNGGSWKTTKPRLEINLCNTFSDKCNQFRTMCRIMRAWKHENGVKINGLLLDTFVYNSLNKSMFLCKSDSNFNFYDAFYSILKYISNEDKSKAYWLAMGSNQYIYNKDKYNFIAKASKAIDELDNCDDYSSKWSMTKTLLGSKFPKNEYEKKCNFNEEFITDRFPLDLEYNLKIDAIVSQDGFRPFSLLEKLKGGILSRKLKYNKKLHFSIVSTNVPGEYEVYWKVRNLGDIAIKRNCIRGNLYKSKERGESTSFNGPHYVECFIVKNGICVARDRISVPIYELS